MDDRNAQNDEILVLKSIYEENDLFSFDEESNSGKFYSKVTLSDTKMFTFNFVNEKTTIKVKHVTPLLLEFNFPKDYPSVNKPNFKLYCRWLSLENLKKLCSKLDDLWTQNANTCVLFTWITFLNDEIFDYLKINVDNELIIEDDAPLPASTETTANSTINNQEDLRAIKQPCSSILFKNYDKDECELKFYNEYFTCNVCFNDKKGIDCIKFNKCEHVFCKECMKTYFETQIADGNVKALTCPQNKCEEQALPAQVLNLVSLDVFNRYDSLLLKDSLNNMSDIVYCPRADCQCAVIPEETLAQCTKCNYVFCSLCRQGYHGIEACKISNAELKSICNGYLHGDATLRQNLIKKYGEKRIQKAVEENLSAEFIQETSKKCPNCKAWMQKLDGCNKMTCSKCHCYFCWLCFKMLSKNDPYSHFNSANSECYAKLFEGVEQDDNNDNIENNEAFNRLNNIRINENNPIEDVDDESDYEYNPADFEIDLDEDEDDDGIVFR